MNRIRRRLGTHAGDQARAAGVVQEPDLFLGGVILGRPGDADEVKVLAEKVGYLRAHGSLPWFGVVCRGKVAAGGGGEEGVNVWSESDWIQTWGRLLDVPHEGCCED